MYQRESFRYKHTGTVAALELPYGPKAEPGQAASAGGEHALSMLVLLPDDRTEAGLAEAVSQLREPALRKLSEQMFEMKVHVWLPRFRLEESVGLSDTLKQLGMKSAFTTAADFSGIAGPGSGLFISDVLHKGAGNERRRAWMKAWTTVDTSADPGALAPGHGRYCGRQR